MAHLSGKAAILAAARRIAELGSSDSDDDEDEDWANWGGIDWKNAIDDEDDDDDDDEDEGGGADEARAGGSGGRNAAAASLPPPPGSAANAAHAAAHASRASPAAVAPAHRALAADLGLPPRLAEWLAKHKGGDVRKAFDVATRVRDRHAALVADADGHVALGRVRPKYKPLEERRVAVKPEARPRARPVDFQPPQTERELRRGVGAAS